MDIRLDDLQRRLSQLQQKLHAHAPPVRTETLVAAAVGALAVGAIAIGAIAIGRLVIGRARIRSLHVDELRIGRLRIEEQPVLQLPPPVEKPGSRVSPS
jgi:hypothetical protein